jgi:hypothetical protein
LKETYSPQLRNAIAHSQYSLNNGIIKYLNYSKDPNANSKINILTYDDWGKYFHNTILIYESLKIRFEMEKEKYYKETLKNEFLEVRIG